jgi:GNAT superfamily N-acetyltransferase
MIPRKPRPTTKPQARFTAPDKANAAQRPPALMRQANVEVLRNDPQRMRHLQTTIGNRAIYHLLSVPRAQNVIQRQLSKSDLIEVKQVVYMWPYKGENFFEKIAPRAIRILERNYNSLAEATAPTAVDMAINNAVMFEHVNKTIEIKASSESFTAYYEDKKIGELDLYYDSVYWLGFIQVDEKYRGYGIGTRLIQAAVEKIGHLFVSNLGQNDHEIHDSNDTRWLTTDGDRLVKSARSKGILKDEWFQNPFNLKMGKKNYSTYVDQAEDTNFDENNEMQESETEKGNSELPDQLPENLTAIQVFFKLIDEQLYFLGVGFYSMGNDPIIVEPEAKIAINNEDEAITPLIDRYHVDKRVIKSIYVD